MLYQVESNICKRYVFLVFFHDSPLVSYVRFQKFQWIDKQYSSSFSVGDDLQRVLLKEYGIRECKVVIRKYFPKKKILSKTEEKSSVRFNVPWLPKTPAAVGGSKAKLAAIATQQNSSNAVAATSFRKGWYIFLPVSFYDFAILD